MKDIYFAIVKDQYGIPAYIQAFLVKKTFTREELKKLPFDTKLDLVHEARKVCVRFSDGTRKCDVPSEASLWTFLEGILNNEYIAEITFYSVRTNKGIEVGRNWLRGSHSPTGPFIELARSPNNGSVFVLAGNWRNIRKGNDKLRGIVDVINGEWARAYFVWNGKRFLRVTSTFVRDNVHGNELILPLPYERVSRLNYLGFKEIPSDVDDVILYASLNKLAEEYPTLFNELFRSGSKDPFRDQYFVRELRKAIKKGIIMPTDEPNTLTVSPGKPGLFTKVACGTAVCERVSLMMLRVWPAPRIPRPKNFTVPTTLAYKDVMDRYMILREYIRQLDAGLEHIKEHISAFVKELRVREKFMILNQPDIPVALGDLEVVVKEGSFEGTVTVGGETIEVSFSPSYVLWLMIKYAGNTTLAKYLASVTPNYMHPLPNRHGEEGAVAVPRTWENRYEVSPKWSGYSLTLSYHYRHGTKIESIQTSVLSMAPPGTLGYEALKAVESATNALEHVLQALGPRVFAFTGRYALLAT